jgi:hypothetical protein
MPVITTSHWKRNVFRQGIDSATDISEETATLSIGTSCCSAMGAIFSNWKSDGTCGGGGNADVPPHFATTGITSEAKAKVVGGAGGGGSTCCCGTCRTCGCCMYLGGGKFG